MTPTQKKILAALKDGEATKKDLREKTGLPRRTIYQAINDALALGLVRERPSLRDTRQTFWSLTEQGRAVVL